MTQLSSSILDYPNRGPWGNAKYRGNCSGYVIKDLLETFKPQKFVEVFSGGGTGRDVAQELGYTNSVHLDLNNGFDALVDDMPVASDFVFSHPPYADIIDYNKVRGTYNADDLSNKMPYGEFIKKLDVVNQKIFQSLVNGGRHAFLVGDVRKQGHYFSIIKDMTWFGDLEDHLIKVQHNTKYGRKNYGRPLIKIAHEHLLVFKKNMVWAVPVKITKDFTLDLRQMNRVTWADLIKATLEDLGGKTNNLQTIYAAIASSKKAKANPHWQAKVRQVLQQSDYFAHADRGVYSLAA